MKLAKLSAPVPQHWSPPAELQQPEVQQADEGLEVPLEGQGRLDP